ncbi:hypothetical protein RA27_15615 [Ruegeria sp. ANG-R]|uniref:hypothetical protein n=1 Tax=Ruegeria sp. ANG-R TaxID=1577903 RepID=UPI00057EA92C|nr:hypothetical protein [Ruegeria sp. ANG-R]KIC40238.1 hypothetical protein RA27_15615 [Ruegeria sp. ANG-R]
MALGLVLDYGLRMDSKLQSLSRADLIALLRKFVPADELERCPDDLLKQKIKRSNVWCRDSAEAVAEEAVAASAVSAILERIEDGRNPNFDVPGELKPKRDALTEAIETDTDATTKGEEDA